MSENMVAKHKDTDLYIVERASSWARWGERHEAIAMPREDWERDLSERARPLVVLVPVRDEASERSGT